MRLDAVQQAMTVAIMRGPEYVPEGLFTGSRAAALRGMAIHANTISHARLVALEDSFPRTRALIGDVAFNRVSRAFIDRGQGAHEPLATFGRQFPAMFRDETAALARFEWLWLESYHAADALALEMANLAGLDEGELLALVLDRHPAARLAPPVSLDRAPALPMLLTRPEGEVRANPASPAMTMLFARLDTSRTVVDLLSHDCGVGEALPALIALVEAGAIVSCGAKP